MDEFFPQHKESAQVTNKNADQKNQSEMTTSENVHSYSVLALNSGVVLADTAKIDSDSLFKKTNSDSEDWRFLLV